MFAAIARPLIDFALPPRCPGCGSIVNADHRFCAPCWRQLDFLTSPGCATCNIPLDAPPGSQCGRCLAAAPTFDGVIAAVDYGETARAVVLALKYGRRPGVAQTIAALLAPRLPPGDLLLVPVPLHRWRLWSRGYNQALEIARALAVRTGAAVDGEWLVRRKATPVLRGLDPGQRARAVAHAFAAAPRDERRDVILIDDVFTTGATANACARVLKRSGARRVTVAAWARVIAHD